MDSDSDSEYEQVANYEFATELTPEELALGEELKKSQMRKNMIIDDSFNRNMHDDDKYAPDFFKEYEDKFVLRSGIDQHISKKSVSWFCFYFIASIHAFHQIQLCCRIFMREIDPFKKPFFDLRNYFYIASQFFRTLLLIRFLKKLGSWRNF